MKKKKLQAMKQSGSKKKGEPTTNETPSDIDVSTHYYKDISGDNMSTERAYSDSRLFDWRKIRAY